MTQGERVKKIRKDRNLTTEKFGEVLGIQRSAVSKIENGRCSLTEANIKAICREFSINEEWLRTGNGEMTIDYPEDEIAELVTDLLMDGQGNALYGMILSIMKVYKRSSPAAQKALNDLIDSVYIDMQKRKSTKKED